MAVWEMRCFCSGRSCGSPSKIREEAAVWTCKREARLSAEWQNFQREQQLRASATDHHGEMEPSIHSLVSAFSYRRNLPYGWKCVI